MRLLEKLGNCMNFKKIFFESSLVVRITIGLVLGLMVAILAPKLATELGILGKIFVRSLRAVAPILIFLLVMSSLANRSIETKGGGLKSILVLYLMGTFGASVIAVALSFMFPSTIQLVMPEEALSPPEGVFQVLNQLIFSALDNPFSALLNANFIGVLVWAVGLGLTLRHASPTTKQALQDLSDAIGKLVQVVISIAPIGVFGLVAETFATNGLETMKNYFHLLIVLLVAMAITAFVLNPLLVYWKTKKNPFPLVLTCLRESGVTAFLTRSSAANIPVNMALAKRLNLNEETYSVAIPLGATINMAGAAITVTVLTLAAVHTLKIPVDFMSAVLLSFVASICACGASGVAGGSLLLIPLACSLFDIPNEISAQVIGVGFVIGVVQDSAETALNSSTDVIFTAAVSMSEQQNIPPKG